MKSNTLIHRLIAAPLKATSRGIRNAAFAIALLMASAQLSSAAVTVTATNDDGIAAATKKNPGDNVTYTIQINSTGTNDATGVTLTDPTAANTSEVAGQSQRHARGAGRHVSADGPANKTVNTATSGFTVVTNDYPGILAGNPVALSALTITTSGTSAKGGIVTMTTSGANVGKFIYAPAPGFTGTDTFTYTISNGVAGTPAGSATATVTITVAGPVIWFVDSTAPAAGNGTWTGTNSKAFQTVAQATTAIGAATNHRIFVLNNSGSSINYANGAVLNSGGWLIGQGATGASFDAFMGITPGTDTPARPSISGVRPTLQGTVTLATNARVQGLNLATTTSTGMNDPVAAITGVTVDEVSVTTTTGTGVNFSGTAGTLTFTGLTTSGGAGANLVGNAGGTFNFSGVVVSSGANAAFTATGGGTVNVTGATNTLTTTTGTALNVANTTIGASGLTFLSINAPTASANPGIVLNTTGAGALTVTGTSTTAGTGGTISNKTGNGVDLRTASNVTLKNMNLTNNAQTNGEANPTLCGATGLNGQNVNCTADVYLGTVSGITLDNVNINGSNQNGINGLNVVDLKIQNGSIVQNCGNESGESGVFIQNLTGLNNALTGSTFSGNRDWQFAVADFTSGALGNAGNPFNVSGCTFIGKGNTTTSEDGFFALIRGTTTANINIGGGANTPSHFKSNFSYGVFTTTADTASATLTVNGCDFGTGGSTTYNNSGIGIGISGASTLNYTISNNTIIGVAVGTPGNGVGIVATTGTTTPGASIIGTISGNTIGDAAISGSGGFNNAAAMQLLANGGGADDLQGHGHREPYP